VVDSNSRNGVNKRHAKKQISEITVNHPIPLPPFKIHK